ncbi:hypothetical protein B0H16DRAFT_1466691 [Mycena metata]|uniref:Uncharacterized protein n=1 Tax=Mycena metata TaxID=1033252 RepID=A0AAD7I738_9AGAR|nr:hypothetical protein B0H16DRAFT_1466691 [Mycena metata]
MYPSQPKKSPGPSSESVAHQLKPTPYCTSQAPADASLLTLFFGLPVPPALREALEKHTARCHPLGHPEMTRERVRAETRSRLCGIDHGDGVAVAFYAPFTPAHTAVVGATSASGELGAAVHSGSARYLSPPFFAPRLPFHRSTRHLMPTPITVRLRCQFRGGPSGCARSVVHRYQCMCMQMQPSALRGINTVAVPPYQRIYLVPKATTQSELHGSPKSSLREVLDTTENA